MRKYAFLKNNAVVAINSVEDDDIRPMILAWEMVIDVEDIVPAPAVGWLLSGNKLVPPTPPVVDANWIKTNKVVPIKTFVDDLLNTVISENIYMGISQAGKSGAVLNFANKKVDVASAPYPVSLWESLTNLTLTVTIDVINVHLANISEYGDLAPFITAPRLTTLKNKVQSFLGLPLT